MRRLTSSSICNASSFFPGCFDCHTVNDLPVWDFLSFAFHTRILADPRRGYAQPLSAFCEADTRLPRLEFLLSPSFNVAVLARRIQAVGPAVVCRQVRAGNNGKAGTRFVCQLGTKRGTSESEKGEWLVFVGKQPRVVWETPTFRSCGIACYHELRTLAGGKRRWLVRHLPNLSVV